MRPTRDPSIPTGLARLIERGVARLGTANDRGLYAALPPLRRKPASAARLLDEARGDAIHLASALTARKAVPDLAMLSLDVRAREVAASLGLPLLPAL